jgi:hypothetical protein
MLSQGSMAFLQRQRIFLSERHVPRYAVNNSHVQLRPVVPLPALIPPDKPGNRVYTIEEKDRVPHKGDIPCPAVATCPVC